MAVVRRSKKRSLCYKVCFMQSIIFAIICASLLGATSLTRKIRAQNLSKDIQQQHKLLQKSAEISHIHGVDNDSSSSSSSSLTLVQFELANLTNGDGINTGTVLIRLRPDWSAMGAARFLELTRQEFWNGCRFFRVIPNFIAQFGMNGDPKVMDQWKGKSIKDEPVLQSNSRGTISFATSGKNTRSAQAFINTKKSGNAYLDKEGFTPFAEVIEGMEFIDSIYDKHRQKPKQGRIRKEGNDYLESEFPELSYIVSGKILSKDS